jgi:hypothetical protein
MGSLTVESGFGGDHWVLVLASGALLESGAAGSVGAIGLWDGLVEALLVIDHRCSRQHHICPCHLNGPS